MRPRRSAGLALSPPAAVPRRPAHGNRSRHFLGGRVHTQIPLGLLRYRRECNGPALLGVGQWLANAPNCAGTLVSQRGHRPIARTKRAIRRALPGLQAGLNRAASSGKLSPQLAEAAHTPCSAGGSRCHARRTPTSTEADPPCGGACPCVRMCVCDEDVGTETSCCYTVIQREMRMHEHLCVCVCIQIHALFMFCRSALTPIRDAAIRNTCGFPQGRFPGPRPWSRQPGRLHLPCAGGQPALRGLVDKGPSNTPTSHTRGGSCSLRA